MNIAWPLATALAALMGAAAAHADPAAQGRATALEVCSPCHVVTPEQAKPPILEPPGPSFAAIAARADLDGAALRAFLARPHGEARSTSRMPRFLLARSEVDAVVAYLMSLKAAR